jgi:serine O-acetyltransferase
MSERPNTRRQIAADLLANTGRCGWRGLMASALFEPGFSTLLLHRLSTGLLRRGLPRSAKLLWRLNTLASACHLHLDAVIAPGLILPHPTGIVIGSGAHVGTAVTIYQNVTLGRGLRDDGYPTIGEGAVIYPGTIVVGGIIVGQRAIVGAGSVVIRDVPDGAVVAGNPARILRLVDAPNSEPCASST